MDKAKNHKPAKLQSQDKAARVAAAKAEVLEAAERFAASWRQSNPLPPTAAELAKRRAEFDQAHKEMLRYIAIRDNQIPPPWIVSSTTESNGSAVQEIATKTATKTWITNEARRMKATGEIAGVVTKVDLAKNIATRMARDPSVQPIKWRSISNRLISWGLWPITKI